jgi:cell division septation protein DedD
MLSGEDFGYLKDNERNKMSKVAKRALLVGAVFFSISCFIYITINAYYFAYHDQENNIRLVKSPDFQIKIADNEENSVNIQGIDKSVYDNIIGNNNLVKENINSAKVIKPANAPTASNRGYSAYSANTIKSINNPLKKISDSNIIVYDKDKNSSTDNSNNISNTSKQKPSAKQNIDNSSIRGLSRVQIAALSSRESAVEYWSQLNNKYPVLFSGYNYFIQEVNLGARGTFYRLQIGNFRNQIDAERFCTQFLSQTKKGRADCIIVE